MWSSRGIFYLSHITQNGELKTFDRLKSEFTIPNQMFFRYLQIRHTFRTQFPAGNPSLDNNPLMEVIKSTDTKKRISHFYNMLSLPQASTSVYALKTRWEGDLGSTKDEEWSEVSDTCKLVSPKLLTQTFTLHRSYLTPLSRYKQDHSINCPMCNQETGTFYHLIWNWPRVHGYWTQKVQFLHDNMGSPLTLHPKPCLLGIFPELDMDKFTKNFFNKTLFSVRKVIAMLWMRPNPPELTNWIVEVNNTLPYKKLMYSNRGCP